MIVLDELEGLLENGEGDQAQKVHLDEPDLLDIFHVVLRHDNIGLGLFEQRRPVDHVAGRDDNAGRVHARLANKALQDLGVLEEFAVLRVAFDRLRQVRRCSAMELSMSLSTIPASFEASATGIPMTRATSLHHHLGLHAAEIDDLAHRLAAVFLDHVIDDFVAGRCRQSLCPRRAWICARD